MNVCINPADMKYSGTIEEPAAITVVNGQKDFSWSAKYTGVKAMRLAPIKARGVEEEDERQPKSRNLDSWVIWSLSGLDATMRFLVDGEYYYIESIRPYKGSRSIVIIDTVKKDSDNASQSALTIARTVLWMNQTTYDALSSYDANTLYVIDNTIADDTTQTIYTAWP